MGKVKVKVLGDEQFEQEQKEAESVKREQKAMREGKSREAGSGSTRKTTKIAGMKGGERTTSVGVSEEEIAAELESLQAGDEPKTSEEKSSSGGKSSKKKKKRVLSKRHLENKRLSNQDLQTLHASIEQLRKFKKSSFDETVELHINTKEKGISGTVILPHGTGKTLRVKVADDTVIAEVEKGKIDFDVLVATPQMMPKLAKVAKVLGPRGLMPNPKNGTISGNPEDAVKKLQGGQIAFRTESVAPVIHLSVGKLSFDDKALSENITTALSAVGGGKIEKVVLKSTMSPAIRLKFNVK